MKYKAMSDGLNIYNTLSFRKFCPTTHNLFQTIESDKSFSIFSIFFINFNLEKLRSLAADVIGVV